MSVEPIPDGVTEPGQNILDPDSIQQLKDLDESGEDTLLHELCDAFLNDSDQHMALIRQSLVIMDIKSISYSAHTLCGGASNFGAVRFTSLCQTVQQFNQETTPERAAELITALENEFKLLKTAMQELQS